MKKFSALIGMALIGHVGFAMAVETSPKKMSPSSVLNEIKFEQRLGESIPADLTFFKENGDPVKLSDYFGSKPLILMLVYHDCPMLCDMQLEGAVKALNVLPLKMGKDFEILTVSFDPNDTPEAARKKKNIILKRLKKPGGEEGWHYLTGKEESILPLLESVGFQYVYDAKSGEYAHPAGLVLLTPEGRIHRYLFNIETSPKDLRWALLDAAQGKIGSPVDQILFYCYHYDPAEGTYSLAVVNVIRVSGLVTVALLGAFIWIYLRREKKKGIKHA